MQQSQPEAARKTSAGERAEKETELILLFIVDSPLRLWLHFNRLSFRPGIMPGGKENELKGIDRGRRIIRLNVCIRKQRKIGVNGFGIM